MSEQYVLVVESHWEIPTLKVERYVLVKEGKERLTVLVRGRELVICPAYWRTWYFDEQECETAVRKLTNEKRAKFLASARNAVEFYRQPWESICHVIPSEPQTPQKEIRL